MNTPTPTGWKSSYWPAPRGRIPLPRAMPGGQRWVYSNPSKKKNPASNLHLAAARAKLLDDALAKILSS